MSRVPVCLVLFVALASHVAAAQMPPGLRVGEQIRIAHWCSAAHHGDVDCNDAAAPRLDTGQLQALDADTLRLWVPDDSATLVIPRGLITNIWVHDGTQGNFGPGVVLGLVGGILIGAKIGSTQEGNCYWLCGLATAYGGLIGAVVGSGIGAIVGSQIRSERWRAVSTDGLHVRLEPGPSGLRLAASMSF